VLATLLVDIVFPSPGGEFWVVTWYDKFLSQTGVGQAASAMGAWSQWNILNQSLAGTLYRLTTPPPNGIDNVTVFDTTLWSLTESSSKLLLSISQLGVCCYLAFVTWPRRQAHLSSSERNFQYFGHSAAVICGMLLLSPMTSKPQFAMLFVPVCYCMTDYFYRDKSRFLAAMMVLVLLCGTLATKDLVGRSLSNHFLGYGSLTLCALACLFATGHVLQTRRRANDTLESTTIPLPLSISLAANEQTSKTTPRSVKSPTKHKVM